MWRLLKQVVHAGMPGERAPQANPDWHTLHAHLQPAAGQAAQLQPAQLQSELLRILGRALCIRQVDAGSCNGCELEINALGNPFYNIEGLGIKFVASPRHADMLLVTGPVTRNMESALRAAYDAMPDPKLVVAAGACACDGGIFGESYATCGRVANVIAVDVTVPGCPPPPIELLRGILTAVTLRQPAQRQGALRL